MDDYQMAVMKQIDTCLTRVFDRKPPLQQKWKAFIAEGGYCKGELHLYHYHHLVLIYHVEKDFIMYEWWEKQADKRGLESAKEWLEERKRKLQENTA